MTDLDLQSSAAATGVVDLRTRHDRLPIVGIAVVVPARDEEARLVGCLRSVVEASRQVRLPVAVVVVLDECTDGSRAAAEAALAAHDGPWDVVDLVRDHGAPPGVGHVRNVGTACARELGAAPAERLWLAHTDADSLVPRDWLSSQVALADAGADAVVGLVDLADDEPLPPEARARHDAVVASRRRPDGSHDNAYGANLGVRASALETVGGFPNPVHGEDTELVALLDAAPFLRVRRTEDHRVVTSARRHGRADKGLAALLDRLSDEARAESG